RLDGHGTAEKFLSERAKALVASGRLSSEVRASRAYLAGFGTTGSLLAGAAVLFLIASAIVSFKGWPQVGAPSSPVAVNVAAKAPGASAPSRAVVAALTSATPTAAGAVVPARRRGGAAARGGRGSF